MLSEVLSSGPATIHSFTVGPDSHWMLLPASKVLADALYTSAPTRMYTLDVKPGLVLKKVAAVMGALALVSGVVVYRLMVSVVLAARVGKTPEMMACRALLPKVCTAFILT